MPELSLATQGSPLADAADLRLLCLMPSIPLGGMERAAARVVEELSSRGADVRFVLENRWAIEVQRHIDCLGIGWTGVPFVASLGMPKDWGEFRWATRSFMKSSSDLRRVAEAYQPRQLLATSLNVAYFGRRLARSETITSVFRLPNPPGVSANRLKRRADRAIWRSVYASFDCLVCNAHYTASRVAEIVDDDSKINVVRNFQPKRRSISRSDVPPRVPGVRRIVYLGQIARHKGVDLLVEAVEDLIAARQNVELLLAGPDFWRDPFGDEIRARVRARGLEDRVRFLGVVADVQGLLAGADVHVCPSVSSGESFPNVLIEAKQAGVPSVVFPTAGLPEAVTDGIDGIVTRERSATALVTAISRLLDDEPLRQRLAEGASRSLAVYDDELVAQRWIEILRAPKGARAADPLVSTSP
jgi:glycosyltransferase involved in cell wall biosynthesis